MRFTYDINPSADLTHDSAWTSGYSEACININQLGDPSLQESFSDIQSNTYPNAGIDRCPQKYETQVEQSLKYWRPFSYQRTAQIAALASEDQNPILPLFFPLSSSWPSQIMPVDLETLLLSDGQFVWGTNVGPFDIRTYLEEHNSELAAYADDIELWASYTSVNPKVLLATLETDQHFVSALPSDYTPAEVRNTIADTSTSLALAFYEYLYTWGTRKSPAYQAGPFVEPAVTFADGTAAQLSPDLSSGTFAIAAVLADSTELDAWLQATSTQNPDGFSQVFGAMFPETDPLNTSNDIDPPASPPDDLLQFPFPLGDIWYFNGPHSWNGGSSPPPYSSMDFYSGGGTCDNPPDLYSVAAAYGDVYRPGGYTCWLEIAHGDGWTTSYYHLRDTYSGGLMGQNGSLGKIGCEVCAGGFATGPHLHFSLKYNGAYISLEGIKLSGWTVHVGPTPYDSGYIERDGETLEPYDLVMNDYHIYFEREEQSLRFYGNGSDDIDRVKIRLDNPPRPADIGANDFTVEWWMKANPDENVSESCTPGDDNWVYGNSIFDRRLYEQADEGEFGISLADGRIAFGVSRGVESQTICGSASVADGDWHHISITRNLEGTMRIFIDGQIDAEGIGPGGDISYTDGRPASHYNDIFLVIGAEKFDTDNPIYPSFSGWIDEVRLSKTIRYESNFTPPDAQFITDDDTVGLYSFNEGVHNTLWDTSGAYSGPSNGSRRYGGSPAGPERSNDTPWEIQPTATPTLTSTATETATTTATATSTSTSTPTATATATATATSTPTATATATATATSTPTATATATATATSTPTATATTIFGDVPYDHWAYDYIVALFNAGYISGCSEEPHLYCPADSMTRGEGAVFVERGIHYAGYMPADPTEQIFADVPLYMWYAKWASALWDDGYTAGCGTDPLIYCPELYHTRAEGCVFYLRMLHGYDYLPPDPTEQIFADVALDSWYAKWVYDAYDAELILPCQTEPELLFCPDDDLIRDMAAYMMVQAKGGLPLP
jgi:hypothetical protein